MTEYPSAYNRLKTSHPQLLDAIESVGQAARQAGPLDDKQVHLLQLAAAAANRSQGGVHSHTRRALEAGASAEEIRHAILVLTSTIGLPQMVAALSWAEDLLDS